MSAADANVILRGGAAEALPPSERIRRVDDVRDTFKLFLGNRYEHFRPTSETQHHNGRSLRVFAWLDSTYVAE
ncbi:DUF5988 family protein [Streptomyces sp. ODS28]|uniref:DUF5988 family protein n=1 Tax=Streptomyces sp. ODS28 TaxID=3136688 RepID=UPI0031EB0517